MDSLQATLQNARSSLGKTVCAALVSNGYKTARFAATGQEAREWVLDLLPDGCSVGVPGTVTVRQLGLLPALEKKGCRVFHHWDPSLTPDERRNRLKEENEADWIVTSSNAMTIDGKMVNIDGVGNRVAGIAWAPGKLLFIVSVNKIESDIGHAIDRARNTATPPNALRVGAKPPCTQTGYCVDCRSSDRICRVVSIIERVPTGREAHVILVGEPLGY